MIPPKPDPVKHCEMCGAPFERRRFGQRLEDRTRFLARRFCSKSCANSKQVVGKSMEHKRARKVRPPTACETCGATENLHVHHIDRNPANNDPANLKELCHSCHLKLHWREDRESRLAAIKAGMSRTGALMRARSEDGRFVSAEKPRGQPNQGQREICD